MSDNAGSKVSFFLVGLGIGALVGILFAPKSGEETREFLSQKADEGREYAQRKAQELRERAEDLVERSKSVGCAPKRESFPRRWMRAAKPISGRKPKRSNRVEANAWKAGCRFS